MTPHWEHIQPAPEAPLKGGVAPPAGRDHASSCGPADRLGPPVPATRHGDTPGQKGSTGLHCTGHSGYPSDSAASLAHSRRIRNRRGVACSWWCKEPGVITQIRPCSKLLTLWLMIKKILGGRRLQNMMHKSILLGIPLRAALRWKWRNTSHGNYTYYTFSIFMINLQQPLFFWSMNKTKTVQFQWNLYFFLFYTKKA